MTNMIDELEYFKFQLLRCDGDAKRFEFLSECIAGIGRRIDLEIVHLRNKAMSMGPHMCGICTGPERELLVQELEDVNKQIDEYEKYYLN